MGRIHDVLGSIIGIVLLGCAVIGALALLAYLVKLLFGILGAL